MKFELLRIHVILLTGVMESCGCGGFCAGFGGGGGGGSRDGSAAFESALLPSPPPASIVLLSSSSTSIGSPGPETSAILSETKRVGGRNEGTRRQLESCAFNCLLAREAGLCCTGQPGPMDAADFKNGPRLARPMPAGARRCRAEIRDDLYKNNPKT